eukprot:scaffold109299_cov32-Tisochrysis_lutea.AAC.1
MLVFVEVKGCSRPQAAAGGGASNGGGEGGGGSGEGGGGGGEGMGAGSAPGHGLWGGQSRRHSYVPSPALVYKHSATKFERPTYKRWHRSRRLELKDAFGTLCGHQSGAMFVLVDVKG